MALLTSRLRYLGWAAVLAVLAAYLLSQMELGGGVPEKLIIIPVLFLGPVVIVALLGLSDLLSKPRSTFAVRAGTLLAIIAFAFFNLMIVVQLTVRAYLRRYIAETPQESTKEMLRWILRGVDPVQLGIDVSFDIFYGLGTIFLAAAMYNHPRFGRWFSATGMLIAGLLLVFNLYAFPEPPADSGLIDFGPLNALWWLAVVIQCLRSRHWAADKAAS